MRVVIASLSAASAVKIPTGASSEIRTPKDGKEQGITIMSLCNITSLFFVGIVQLLSFKGGTFSGSFDLKPARDCRAERKSMFKTWYRSPKKTLNNNNGWLYGFEGWLSLNGFLGWLLT